SRCSLFRTLTLIMANLFILLLFFVCDARAQWTMVGPNLKNGGGCATFSDGVAWVSGSYLYSPLDKCRLYKSLDSGKTWIFAHEFIYGTYNLSFFDRNIGLVSSGDSLWMTEDQGNTWRGLPVWLFTTCFGSS